MKNLHYFTSKEEVVSFLETNLEEGIVLMVPKRFLNHFFFNGDFEIIDSNDSFFEDFSCLFIYVEIYSTYVNIYFSKTGKNIIKKTYPVKDKNVKNLIETLFQ